MTPRKISMAASCSFWCDSSSLVFGSFDGASTGTTNVAMSSVTMITPHARKMSSERWGNRLGRLNITANEMVPLAPESVMMSDSRRSSRSVGHPWNPRRERPRARTRDMASTQMQRIASSTNVMPKMTSSRNPLLMEGSSQVCDIASGSCVPRSTNTTPLRPNENTCQTLAETMFMRETDGLLSRGEMTLTRPPATTAMTPLTWKASATK